jgi:hypothetical protein
MMMMTMISTKVASARMQQKKKTIKSGCRGISGKRYVAQTSMHRTSYFIKNETNLAWRSGTRMPYIRKSTVTVTVTHRWSTTACLSASPSLSVFRRLLSSTDDFAIAETKVELEVGENRRQYQRLWYSRLAQAAH